MAKTPRQSLLVVAHPDDETIFFGGLLLSRASRRWKVICVTDGGADGRAEARREELQRALRELGVQEHEHWDFPDIYEKRLDWEKLRDRLKELPRPAAIYTHGALGEYGHPHHQDVSRAVHDAFEGRLPVWSPAYNCYPEKILRLTRPQFEKKLRILAEAYALETQRFLNLLPVTWAEGWVRAKPSEVRALHDAFRSGGEMPDSSKLRAYRAIARVAGRIGYGKIPRVF